MASLALVGTLAAALAGCSVDVVIWGPEGARVISTTEQLIDVAASGEHDPLACAGGIADSGEPSDWEGLSAGEPEPFRGDYWEEQIPLDPAWSINLELGAEGAVPGRVFPGDVFYRETADGLCVVDIAWATVVS
jgi:hypothetical protein